MSSESVIEAIGLGKGFKSYARPAQRLAQFGWQFAARLAPFPPLRAWLRTRAEAAGRTFWALRDVNLSVRRGETVGIIGRNGSGKSTLLQMVCGTLAPTEGTIRTEGRIAALLELGSGFDPEYTGRENVYMNGQLHGLTQQQVDARFADIEAFADIGTFMDQPVKTYSSGMFVRLAFAVIAHVDADILVIDEALAVGDAFFTQKCMRFLRRFMQTGTVLFVSHDSAAIRSLCSRAVWIDHGSVLEQGDPKAVSNRYLERFYGADQDTSGASAATSNHVAPERIRQADDETRHDQRLQFPADDADTSGFTFDPHLDAPAAQATLNTAELLRADGSRMLWASGGEIARLHIEAVTQRPVDEVVVAFVVKDKLGRMLFGDHTYWSAPGQALPLSNGGAVTAAFEFVMPVLTPGDYAIDVIVADAGRATPQSTLCHVHDACVFKSEAATSSTGLVGLPMTRISLTREPSTL